MNALPLLIAEPSHQAQLRPQVLIVDDQPANVMLLQKALAQDYGVLSATSGADGIAIAQRALPDVILLDVMMPGMDGFEVCRLLKADSNTADIPVLFVTALDRIEDELQGLQLGAVDYITKPINIPVVRARVKSQVELRKYQRLRAMLSNLDGLTGLSNRQYFESRLRHEWVKARAEGQPISLIIADLDQFDAYVTRFGRIAGDECLKVVAGFVSQALQEPGDLAVRLSGDEFLLLLPDTPLEQAQWMAEELRRSVEEAALPHPDGDWGCLTVSCCVATQIPDTEDLPGRFLEHAEALVSAAKFLGRNRVVNDEDVAHIAVPQTPSGSQRDQEAIVHSIAAITDQQDLQSLDQGLMIALQEMLQPAFLMILESGDQGGLQTVIAQGAVEGDLPASLSAAALSLQDHQPHLLVVGDTHYLYCALEAMQGDRQRVLVLGGKGALGGQVGVFKGMLRVYQNFIRLMREGQRDTLTGLQNRKTLEAELSTLLSSYMSGRRTTDRNKGAALAVLDLDKFKRINDTFGHLIGDEVLLIFSQILKSSLRAPDRPFRYGGEEFIAILNDVSDTEAVEVLERLRQNVENRDFPQVGRVTVSIGYTLLGTQLMPAQVIEEADKALYYAKENGRNQVRSYADLPKEAGAESSTSGDIELF